MQAVPLSSRSIADELARGGSQSCEVRNEAFQVQRIRAYKPIRGEITVDETSGECDIRRLRRHGPEAPHLR